MAENFRRSTVDGASIITNDASEHRNPKYLQIKPVEVAEGAEPSIDAYLDAALRNTRLASDRQLAFLLNVSPSTIHHWRKRKAWPSDETMLRLAAEAGADPDEALLHLKLWTAQSATTKSVVLKMIGALWAAKGEMYNPLRDCVIIFGFISLFLTTNGANAAGTSNHQVFQNYILCE